MRDVCERYGVVRLEIFGSVARGTASDESDIDLLYTLAPGAARLGHRGPSVVV
ncbi:MAG: nucleotidyltransferase domain-containing protein [Micropruina sp.]